MRWPTGSLDLSRRHGRIRRPALYPSLCSADRVCVTRLTWGRCRVSGHPFDDFRTEVEPATRFTVTNMLPNYEERILIIRKGHAGISTVSRKLGIEGATR
eukprot:7104087-Prymnesium_polylepis.1